MRIRMGHASLFLQYVQTLMIKTNIFPKLAEVRRSMVAYFNKGLQYE